MRVGERGAPQVRATLASPSVRYSDPSGMGRYGFCVDSSSSAVGTMVMSR